MLLYTKDMCVNSPDLSAQTGAKTRAAHIKKSYILYIYKYLSNFRLTQSSMLCQTVASEALECTEKSC